MTSGPSNIARAKLRMEQTMSLYPCPCGSQEYGEWQYDARGIELCKTCPKCHREKMARYRPEVLTDSQYECTEAIEAEDY